MSGHYKSTGLNTRGCSIRIEIYNQKPQSNGRYDERTIIETASNVRYFRTCNFLDFTNYKLLFELILTITFFPAN